MHAKKFAESKNPSSPNIKEAINSKEYHEIVLKDFEAKAKEQNLTSLERVKKIYLTDEPFTQDNNLITPTMKIKRNIAKKVFLEQIN